MEAYKKYCILRSSLKVRNAIRHRLKERGISDNAFCKSLNIPPPNFNAYMKGDAKVLNQYTVLRICKELGIEIDIQVTFT